MMLLRTFFLFLIPAISGFTFCQNPNSKVSIELSIPHTREIPHLYLAQKANVFVIIRNGSDSSRYFYEAWNSWGYYNISFEIRYQDSIYQVVRPRKLWYRNYPSYHTVQPGESLVFPVLLIDTGYANALSYDRIFEDGWLGIPSISDTVEIRTVYRLSNPETFIAEERIGRLNYRKDDYMDYLDGDIESGQKDGPVKKVEKPKKTAAPKQIPDTTSILIFNEPLVSGWQKVIL